MGGKNGCKSKNGAIFTSPFLPPLSKWAVKME
jgi:hypothetical protein